jgi:hypothetical protein
MQDLKQFDKYVGRKYSEVMFELKDHADGKSVFSWPEGTPVVSRDGGAILVIVNNDVDNVIVRFENG